MRLTDAIYGFPAVLSALLVTAVFGPGVLISMVAVGIAYVPAFARLTRANILALREQDFVMAARALGARDGAIVWRHVLPNTVSPLIVQATISFPLAILAEAALSYLGLGTQPPHPSWGLMLRDAQNFLQLSPWFAVFPGGGHRARPAGTASGTLLPADGRPRRASEARQAPVLESRRWSW